MVMRRWEPFREIMSLRDAMDQLLNERFVWPYQRGADEAEGNLPIDMYQTDKEVVIKTALPGVQPDEVDISITGDRVTIKGEHKEEEVKEENYFRKEQRYGRFSRSLPLPVAIKSDKTEAVFENGVLTLTMPKSEETKPKQIKIKPKPAIEGAKSKSKK